MKLKLDKTGVINDPLGQPTVPDCRLIRHSHASSEHCFLLFCFSRFEKRGRTFGRTEIHVRKQLSLPAVTLAWPSGSILPVLAVAY